MFPEEADFRTASGGYVLAGNPILEETGRAWHVTCHRQEEPFKHWEYIVSGDHVWVASRTNRSASGAVTVAKAEIAQIEDAERKAIRTAIEKWSAELDQN